MSTGNSTSIGVERREDFSCLLSSSDCPNCNLQISTEEQKEHEKESNRGKTEGKGKGRRFAPDEVTVNQNGRRMELVCTEYILCIRHTMLGVL